MVSWYEAPGIFVEASDLSLFNGASSVSSIIQNVLLVLIAFVVFLRFLPSTFASRRPGLRLPPGPRPFPVFGNWLQFRRGLNPRNLAQLAQRYGDVCLLRMGQRNVVVVSSPDMAKEVLQTHGVEFGSRARNLVFDMTTGKGADMAFADYGDHWRKMRRIATLPFFTSKVVQQSTTAWEEEIGLAVHDIGAAQGSTTTGTTIRDRLQLMMYNIMYRMMFQKRFDSERDPLYVKLMILNAENGKLAQSFKYNYGDFVPILKPLLRGYLKDVWQANQQRLAFLRDAFLDVRKREGNREKVGVDYFLDAFANGEIDETNVLYLIQNMNVAAIETTLWSSEWAIAELANRPAIQTALCEELDRVLGKGSLLTEPDLPKLPYLQAVVKETLRAHMVIPMLLPHMNLHDAKLGSYDIPAGSRILVNAWGIANNPRYWDTPEEFRPERFLNEKSIEPNGNDFTFLPFGSGRRSCPGMLLALPLLGLIIGRLTQRYELLPPPGLDKVNMTETGGQLSLSIAEKSRVVVKPRM